LKNATRTGRPPQKISDTVEGFGPCLYGIKYKEWKSWLGRDGQSISALLKTLRYRKGAIPDGYHFLNHREGKIKASDIPQWKWTNKECRQWLVKVLVEYCSIEKDAADAEAKKFEGFGPILYLMELHEWMDWLGRKGQAIHSILVPVRHTKGAVPTSFTIKHAKNKAKDGKENVSGTGKNESAGTSEIVPVQGNK
jgi:hypothetical protein